MPIDIVTLTCYKLLLPLNLVDFFFKAVTTTVNSLILLLINTCSLPFFLIKLNLRTLLQQGVCHPEIYGDVIHKLGIIRGQIHFLDLFIKAIKTFRKKDYGPIILQRTACFVIGPLTVGTVLVLIKLKK